MTTTYRLTADMTDRPANAPLAPERIRHDADGWHAVYPAENGLPDEQYETVEDLLAAHELEREDFAGLALAHAQASQLAKLWQAEGYGEYGDGESGGAEWLYEGLNVPAGRDPGEFFAQVEPLFVEALAA
jgi:hypothetical protein